MDIYPSAEVLKDALGKSYVSFEKLMTTITTEEVGLEPQWNYYKDGNAWLCKIVHKKKTIIWLSVWADHFEVVLYFNKKTAPGVFDLDIPQELKDQFDKAQTGVNFKPMVFEVSEEIDLDVVLKVVEYKKS